MQVTTLSASTREGFSSTAGRLDFDCSAVSTYILAWALILSVIKFLISMPSVSNRNFVSKTFLKELNGHLWQKRKQFILSRSGQSKKGMKEMKEKTLLLWEAYWRGYWNAARNKLFVTKEVWTAHFKMQKKVYHFWNAVAGRFNLLLQMIMKSVVNVFLVHFCVRHFSRHCSCLHRSYLFYFWRQY